MRKIVVFGVGMIVLAIMAIVAGYGFGWSVVIVGVALAIVAASCATTFSVSAIGAAGFAALAGTFVAVVTVYAPGTPVFIVVTIFAVLLVFVTANVAPELKARYHWLFLDLLIEATAVWAIIRYGLGLLKQVFG